MPTDHLPEPQISPIPRDSDEYELLANYVATACGYRTTVMRGYVTDGASIPPLLWPVIGNPWNGLVLPAAIIHDALYESELVPRSVADEIFYQLLRRGGVGRAKAWAMWAAVRSAGWAVWRGHTRASTTRARELVRVVKCMAVVAIMAALSAGCQSFTGERTSTIKLNILGNTWESTTTCKGTYPEKAKTDAP